LVAFSAFTWVESAAAPQITGVQPLGIVPGTRTVVTFEGRDLAGISKLWTSFPSEAALIPGGSEGEVTFAVTCPAEVRGVQAVQLVGTNGATAFRLVLIDHLKVFQTSQAKKEALNLLPPIAVDSAATQESIDYYALEAKAGQNFSIEAIAHRIGSQMDPVVTVRDATGKEVAFCEDEPGIWRDARFRFTAPLDGAYQLAVHDTAFNGGRNHYYRLRVSDDPLVWSTFPLVDPAERGARLETLGVGERGIQGSPANPPESVLIPGVPQMGEIEPNDSSAQAQELPTFVVINGKLQNGWDVDWYHFQAAKDQRLIFRSQTRALGSACDLALRIRDQHGAIVKENDPGAAGDASLTNKFDAAGRYYLEVRELSGMGITNAAYRIQVKDFAPGFELLAEDNIVEVTPGGNAKLKVSAARFDYDGPIDLKVEPELPGLALEGNLIAEGKKEVEMTVKAAETATPGTYQVVKFTGNSSGGQQNIFADVSTRSALRKTFPLLLSPPQFLDGLITIVIREK
jgi:hypothetical protein